MATHNRREVLQQLLTGLFQVAGAATVVLASASVQAGVSSPGEEKPVPVPGSNEARQNLERRVEQALANSDPVETVEEVAWVNGAFRNAAFRNSGGGGGGFRNSGFANGGGGGGFRNSAFRNY